jgi:hypothetical protein
LTVELSSPPTYWIGFDTDESLGSRRGKTDSPAGTAHLGTSGKPPAYVAALPPGEPREHNPRQSPTGGMRHMLDHLMQHPEKALLGYESNLPSLTTVQNWRSGLGKAAG